MTDRNWNDDDRREYERRPVDELALRRARPAPAGEAQLALDVGCGVEPIELLQRWLGTNQTALDGLFAATTAIAGRDGWRIDAAGREWYSASWIGRR